MKTAHLTDDKRAKNQMKHIGVGRIDSFRIIAALLIVAIHTEPLTSLSLTANFLFTHVFTRIAVPFFLMVTGYFLLSQNNSKPLVRFVKKTSLIYLLASLLYLPVSIYARHYDEGFIPALLIRKIIFDGTFYHLWYLPAAVIGVSVISVLRTRLSVRSIAGVAILLYIIGLLGDSYYGLVTRVSFLHSIYDVGFHIFSYTRNGIFYAPLFLVMGAFIIGKEKRRLSAKASLIGFIFAMALMLVEGIILYHFRLQRHDSMYIALIPCMFFLFSFLLAQKGKMSYLRRDVSLLVYILHPLFIIVVRGIAKATGLTGLLVDNSIVHYFAVCFLSVSVSVLISVFWRRFPLSDLFAGWLGLRPFQKGRAFIELDMKNLRHNVEVLQGRLPDGCQLMPAVKANAYGHGMIPIARELNACGVRAFCVASVAEGVTLRKHHIKGVILILGGTHPQQFPLLRRYRLTQTVIDHDDAVLLNRFGKKITVHVKIDTGMHRLGERSENIDQIIKVFSYDNLIVSGIYTHLCVVDSDKKTDQVYTQAQINHFHDVLFHLNNQLSKISSPGDTINGLRNSNLLFKSKIASPGGDIINSSNANNFECAQIKTHVHSSYGIFSGLEKRYDYARPGIALYGMLSNYGDDEKLATGLLPVLSLKTRISMIKALYAGEAAGYALAFTAPYDMRIAILPIGYADGIPRTLSENGGYVLINGYQAPIIGRICMDQMTVDVTDAKGVKSGDIAVIIGTSGETTITVGDIANQTGTIANEILSRLGERIERVACEQSR